MLGKSEALRQLLTECVHANQVTAPHTLGLHPGLINEPWAGEMFDVAGVWWVFRGCTAIIAASIGGYDVLVLALVLVKR